MLVAYFIYTDVVIAIHMLLRSVMIYIYHVSLCNSVDHKNWKQDKIKSHKLLLLMLLNQ